MPKPTPTKPALTRRERRAEAHKHSDRSPTPDKNPADFSSPHEVDRITALCGAGNDVYALMPAIEDIPDDFKSWANPFNRLQARWFFNGLEGAAFVPRPGINRLKALAHLCAIQRSWTPPHEHKAAGVAYLMSLWFEPPKS